VSKRIAFVALSSRLARATGLDAGTQVFVGDLRDGVSVADLQHLLKAGAVEMEVLPAPPPKPIRRAVVDNALKSGPVAVVKPVPVVEVSPVDPDKPVVVENAKVEPKVETNKANAAALEEAVALDEAVKALADANSKDQLVKMAKKAKVTFSPRGTKHEIARKIVEGRKA